MCKATSVVKWFNDNGLNLENSLSGNIKLNKLLVFAQLLNIVSSGEKLFDEDIYAFKQGLVVEEIRLQYKNYRTFTKSLTKTTYNFDKSEVDILDKTMKIFSHLDSNILSDLTHQFKFWKDNYEHSRYNNYHYKEDSIIKFESILKEYKNDIAKIKTLLDVEIDEGLIPIQLENSTFYYDPSETKIKEDIISELKKYPADEESYSFYFDETQGLVVY
ncbi:DUF4065 domain-containing protein [Clostridium sp. NSJ-49]|uniref:Panacea domain-containing protein n=1 Tax=Clostridium TaxID=1485 RepID=UPI00164B02F5|nr:type II toxin-antitoxin system antitoxin SocA domain-containing protein [Clostridium sp. NSJ-49]MBC5626168.1 DUF4065 domain-containing protein [Clostridium sp. NSJ-49]